MLLTLEQCAKPHWNQSGANIADEDAPSPFFLYAPCKVSVSWHAVKLEVRHSKTIRLQPLLTSSAHVRNGVSSRSHAITNESQKATSVMSVLTQQRGVGKAWKLGAVCVEGILSS